MQFLLNTWYAAAWADEVASALLPRQILGERVVLFRTRGGQASALADRCPHRFAPLSLGRLVDDQIECGYHGLRFDGAGACTFNPQGNGMLPPRATVRRYPLVERDALLWIWMGDDALADPATIPDFGFHVDPAYQNVKGYTLAEAHYELLTDNLMDLGHIEFLHAGLLGSEAVRKAHTEVLQDGSTVLSKRLTRDEILPPVLQRWYEAGARPVQRWLDMRWQPAAAMKLTVGVLPNGEPRSSAHESQGAHLLTPATATRTHYFWSQGRNWGGHDPQMDATRLESLRKAFDTQDKPMIEAVQRNMGTWDLASLEPVMLAGDGGPVRARRVLRELLAQERPGPAVDAAQADATPYKR